MEGAPPDDPVHGSGALAFKARRWTILAALVLVTFAARWTTRTDFLLHYDTLQLVSGLTVRDLGIDMPHPPGSPVYSLLLAAAGPLAGGADDAPFLVGSVCDAALVVLVLALGSRLFGREIGWVAAVLAALCPLGWHSSATGTFFAVSALGSVAGALSVIIADRRRSSPAVLVAGIVPALAVGATINPNLAAGIQVLLLLWLARRLPGRLRATLLVAFAATLALCIVVPALLAADAGRHFVALVDAYRLRAWAKSPSGLALAEGLPRALGALGRACLQAALLVSKSLALALPFLAIGLLPPRRGRSPERSAWHRRILVCLAGIGVLFLVLPYDSEQYVAVAFPALCVLAALGTVRIVGILERGAGLFPIRVPSRPDLVHRALLTTHLIIFVAASSVMLWVLFALDPSGSLSVGGRESRSLREQLRAPGTPRLQAQVLIPAMRVLERATEGEKDVLFVTQDPVFHNFLCLYGPERITSLWVVRRKGAVGLATGGVWETLYFGASGSVRLERRFGKVIYAAPAGAWPVTFELPSTPPPSGFEVAPPLGALATFDARGLDLQVDAEGEHFFIRTAAGPRPGVPEPTSVGETSREDGDREARNRSAGTDEATGGGAQ